jgi:hypothetical protein
MIIYGTLDAPTWLCFAGRIAVRLHQEGRRARYQEMDADWFEVWMIAGLLVDEHDKRAVAIARARAERASSEDDVTGSAVWRAVICAAETYLGGADPDARPRSGPQHQ